MLRRSSADRQRRQNAPQGQQQGGQAGEQPAIDFSNAIRITADPATNALIITAVPEDFAILLPVIQKLDIRRRQVYVEAIILEVTLDRMRDLGIELQGGIGVPNGTGFGRTNLGNLNTALTNPGTLSGLVLAAVSDRTVTLPDGTQVPAQAALLTALQTDNDVNILSAPNILTTDNEEAEIVVGQNVPFVASRSTNETNLANTFATIEREDVGITLRLTPQISEGSVVRMALFEEVSALVANPLLNANDVGPTTTIRSTNTTITVRDGQTVVIGGLISDSLTSDASKVPFLSDVPVIGQLFTKTHNEKSKINLLIFLTPHIIKNESDAADVSVAERDKFRDMMHRSRAPRHYPDPLDKPSFELQDDLNGAPPDIDGRTPPGADAPHTTNGQAVASAPPPEPPGAPDGHLDLTDVSVDRRNNGALVHLALTGTPDRISHYALSDPGRYVIDVYGPSDEVDQVENIDVADSLLRRVRVAHHRGRMRMVLDLKTDHPPAYVLDHGDGTISLELGAARPTKQSKQGKQGKRSGHH